MPQSSLLSSDDNIPWFALRIFNHAFKHVVEYLDNCNLVYFVPMTYSVRIDDEGKKHMKLVPVVTNLVFLKKTDSYVALKSIVSDCPYPVTFFKSHPNDTLPCEISSNEMKELICICDPERITYKYISEQDAQLKSGTPVLVSHGPLQGMQGKLVRSNRHYYIIRTFAGGLSLMLKVSRWCCKPVNDD